jgi:hypothetical protein
MSVFLLYSQTIPILIATLSSIGNGSFTLFDAHFAVAVSASPMSAYVSLSCFLQLCLVETPLFKRISSTSKGARFMVLGLGILFPLLWFSVSITASFSETAFTNSSYCRGMTFLRYLEFFVVSSMVGVLDVMGRRDLYDDVQKRGCLGILSLGGLFLWGILLVRHQEEIIRIMKDYHKVIIEDRPPHIQVLTIGWYFQLSKKYFLLVLYVPKVCWWVFHSLHIS